MRIALMLILMFAFVPKTTIGQADTKSEGDIREATFRYMFEHEVEQQIPHTKVLFISINKKDPDDKFTARFKENSLPVKKVSESIISGDVSGVMDTKTGGSGILYNTGEIKWLENGEVEIDGSYYVASLFAGGCRYRVVREEDKWIVRGCKGMKWIS